MAIQRRPFGRLLRHAGDTEGRILDLRRPHGKKKERSLIYGRNNRIKKGCPVSV